MSWLSRLWCRYGINSLDCVLKNHPKNKKANILICWNRGLGDIPLGLCALKHRILHFLPGATLTFLTREDLREGFALLEGAAVLVDPTWKRYQPYDLDQTFARLSLKKEDFTLVLEKPDPTRTLMWQLKTFTPKLRWKEKWDSFDFSDIPSGAIGIHLHSETSYGYEKNWPQASFVELIDVVTQEGKTVLLFGHHAKEPFIKQGVIDLRGKTSLLQTLSLIKNRCSVFLGPDSGLLSLTYYLDVHFPIHLVSLWADPRQGILKQGVPSPNLQLLHTSLLAPGGKLENLPMERVLQAISVAPIVTDTYPAGKAP